MSYPLDIFKKNKHAKYLKSIINSITNKLYGLLKNCKRLKTNTWTIENFFKVAKNTFGFYEKQLKF